MSSPEIPVPVPAGRRSLGGLRELLVFLLAAVALFPLVQYAGLWVYLYFMQQQSPGAGLPELLDEAIRRVQFNAFFLVPVQVAYGLLLLLLLYGLVSRVRGLPFWRSLALKALPPQSIGSALLAGGLLALVVQVSNLISPPPETLGIDRLFTSRLAAALIVVVSVTVAPFIEELVFRGYIYTLLEGAWGMTPAVLASGLLFGSIHFPQLYPGYFQMLLLCVVGIVFSLARARTGTVVASMVLHCAYNGTISLLFLLSPQFRELPLGG